jgi:cytochrome d ubiquinol oxidase subunit II
MIVLWLLILRGSAIEFRSHIESPVWAPLWDVVFCVSSLLLTVFYGAALGNVVRGVPLDARGYFFEPLWTNFRLGPNTGILDWYTILIGIAAFAALSLHGATWVLHKTSGPVHDRAWKLARQLWWGVLLSTAVITLVTFNVQPQVPANLSAHTWGYVFPALAAFGLIAMKIYLGGAETPQSDTRAFLSSSAYLVGMLTSVVFGVYPYVLPAITNPAWSLTIHNAKAADYGLRIGLIWWVIGIGLASGYFIFLYRYFAGKVEARVESSHY